MIVVKRDASREPFQLKKVREGIERACEKRPVSAVQIDKIVGEVERELLNLTDREVPTELIGKIILKNLKNVDHVAYVRFASVYKQFHDLQDFAVEIQSLMKG